jgi:uncharacterized protein YbdZ (MbtH family)
VRSSQEEKNCLKLLRNWNNNYTKVPSKEELKKIWKEMQHFGDKEDCVEFLSKLWLFTEQASEKHLNKLWSRAHAH